MTIIDCHTHLGRNDHIRVSADQLLESMDEAGIDKSLVFAGELNDAPNEWVLEQIAPHKDRLLGVASVNPQWEAKYLSSIYDTERQAADKEAIKKIIDWYGEGKIVACKFYVGYDHYYPSDPDNFLQALNDLGCPAIFHSGDCLNSVKCAKLKYAHPLHIDEVAVDYPKMNFIIAHMGFPYVRDAAEVCYKNDNVYTDISGFVYGKFEGKDSSKFNKAISEFLDIAGSSKLLFGTDFPIANQLSYIETLKSMADQENDFYVKMIYSPEYMTYNTKRVFNLK